MIEKSVERIIIISFMILLLPQLHTDLPWKGRSHLEPTKIHERTADDDSWLKIFSSSSREKILALPYDVMIGFLVQQVSKFY